MIRPASVHDASDIARLTEIKREEYEAYQPTFWRRAENAQSVHEQFLRSVLAQEGLAAYVLVLDGEVCGFVAARRVEAPPVYAPGGATLLVDDFVVEPPTLWAEHGPALIAAVWADDVAVSAVQLVVVCGHDDARKRDMLRACGLEIGSEWWLGGPPPAH